MPLVAHSWLQLRRDSLRPGCTLIDSFDYFIPWGPRGAAAVVHFHHHCFAARQRVKKIVASTKWPDPFNKRGYYSTDHQDFSTDSMLRRRRNHAAPRHSTSLLPSGGSRDQVCNNRGLSLAVSFSLRFFFKRIFGLSGCTSFAAPYWEVHREVRRYRHHVPLIHASSLSFPLLPFLAPLDVDDVPKNKIKCSNNNKKLLYFSSKVVRLTSMARVWPHEHELGRTISSLLGGVSDRALRCDTEGPSDNAVHEVEICSTAILSCMRNEIIWTSWTISLCGRKRRKRWRRTRRRRKRFGGGGRLDQVFKFFFGFLRIVVNAKEIALHIWVFLKNIIDHS